MVCSRVYTHIDAPRHMFPDGYTTSEFELERLTGRATVIDVSEVADNSEISDSDDFKIGPPGAGSVILSW